MATIINTTSIGEWGTLPQSVLPGQMLFHTGKGAIKMSLGNYTTETQIGNDDNWATLSQLSGWNDNTIGTFFNNKGKLALTDALSFTINSKNANQIDEAKFNVPLKIQDKLTTTNDAIIEKLIINNLVGNNKDDANQVVYTIAPNSTNSFITRGLSSQTHSSHTEASPAYERHVRTTFYNTFTTHNNQPEWYGFALGPNRNIYPSIGYIYDDQKRISFGTSLFRWGKIYADVLDVLSLKVTNGTTLNGTVDINNNLTVASDKTTTLGGPLKVINDKATELSGTLTVSGAATLNEAVNINNSLSVASGYNTTLGGDLSIEGNSVLTNSLIINKPLAAGVKVDNDGIDLLIDRATTSQNLYIGYKTQNGNDASIKIASDSNGYSILRLRTIKTGNYEDAQNAAYGITLSKKTGDGYGGHSQITSTSNESVHLGTDTNRFADLYVKDINATNITVDNLSGEWAKNLNDTNIISELSSKILAAQTSNILSQLPPETATTQLADTMLIARTAGDSQTQFVKTPFSKVWNYIENKLGGPGVKHLHFQPWDSSDTNHKITLQGKMRTVNNAAQRLIEIFPTGQNEGDALGGLDTSEQSIGFSLNYFKERNSTTGIPVSSTIGSSTLTPISFGLHIGSSKTKYGILDYMGNNSAGAWILVGTTTQDNNDAYKLNAREWKLNVRRVEATEIDAQKFGYCDSGGRYNITATKNSNQYGTLSLAVVMDKDSGGGSQGLTLERNVLREANNATGLILRPSAAQSSYSCDLGTEGNPFRAISAQKLYVDDIITSKLSSNGDTTLRKFTISNNDYWNIVAQSTKIILQTLDSSHRYGLYFNGAHIYPYYDGKWDNSASQQITLGDSVNHFHAIYADYIINDIELSGNVNFTGTVNLPDNSIASSKIASISGGKITNETITYNKLKFIDGTTTQSVDFSDNIEFVSSSLTGSLTNSNLHRRTLGQLYNYFQYKSRTTSVVDNVVWTDFAEAAPSGDRRGAIFNTSDESQVSYTKQINLDTDFATTAPSSMSITKTSDNKHLYVQLKWSTKCFSSVPFLSDNVTFDNKENGLCFFKIKSSYLPKNYLGTRASSYVPLIGYSGHSGETQAAITGLVSASGWVFIQLPKSGVAYTGLTLQFNYDI